MERDMAQDKRDAWERDVEKMRHILAVQGRHIFRITAYSNMFVRYIDVVGALWRQ